MIILLILLFYVSLTNYCFLTLTSCSQRDLNTSLVSQAVKSPSLDYSHFVSLPLAIHPELVDKLVNFQNTILGITDACLDENVGSESNEDASDNEENEQQVDREHKAAVELKLGNNTERVKVDITSIPLVSYEAKASGPSTSSGENHCIL